MKQSIQSNVYIEKKECPVNNSKIVTIHVLSHKILKTKYSEVCDSGSSSCPNSCRYKKKDF